MLIQITNMCHEGCKHCLQSSTPQGQHMTFETFKDAVKFGIFLGIKTFIISGGEPTEHPLFFEFCQWLDNYLGKSNVAFAITSNGMWYPDKAETVKNLASLRHYVGMQVFTHKVWYKDYEFILSHKDEISAIPKVMIEEAPLYMQDLGRAKYNQEAQKCIGENPYHMSCLNGHLIAKQSPSPKNFGEYAMAGKSNCKPCVDYLGNVHLSESRHCQSFGNVSKDLMLSIFKAMKDSKPCLQCRLGIKYAKSSNLAICKSKVVLGIPLITNSNQ